MAYERHDEQLRRDQSIREAAKKQEAEDLKAQAINHTNSVDKDNSND